MSTLRLALVMAMVGGLVSGGPARADITLAGHESWDGSVMHTITPTGSGTLAAPYVYDLGAQNLDLNGWDIHTNATKSSTAARNSVTWLTTGSVLNSGAGGGSFYAHGTESWIQPGSVRIEAGGSIAANNVLTHGNFQVHSGDTYLAAENGPVTLGGYLDTRTGHNSYYSGDVTIISKGAGAGITVGGSSAGYSINTRGQYGYGAGQSGVVKLYTSGDVTLAGGIRSDGGNGSVTIRGENAGERAGDVSIGGNVYTRVFITYQTAGNVYVLANSLDVNGYVDAHAEHSGLCLAGNVDVNALEDCTIAGYVRADNTVNDWRSPSGHVYLTGKRIFVGEGEAADGIMDGVSINTTDTYAGTYNGGNGVYVAPGDGDVKLTCTDSSADFYDPADPLHCDTSAISVAGQILTGYLWDGVNRGHGDVYTFGVEVQLGDAITTQAGTYSDIDIHCGVDDYGILTHLVEGGDRWLGGLDPHNIVYTAGGTTTFYYEDVVNGSEAVPYAGSGGPIPEPAGLGLLGLALLGLRRRRK